MRDEIALYMWAWQRHELHVLLQRDGALDHCLLQKVLPRCQGSSETARRALENVFRLASSVVAVDSTGAGDAAGAASVSLPADSEAAPATAVTRDASEPLPEEVVGAVDPRTVTEPTGSLRWKYPKTARKSLAMLRRYVDTGFFAYWS